MIYYLIFCLFVLLLMVLWGVFAHLKMERAKKIFGRIVGSIFFIIGTLPIISVVAVAWALTCDSVSSNEFVENKIKVGDFKTLYESGGEFSVGRENVEEVLYSIDSHYSSFTGDGYTFVKFKAKKDILARITKENSPWQRCDNLSDFMRKALDAAFNFAGRGEFQKPDGLFTKRYYIFPLHVKAFFSVSDNEADPYIEEFLIYDAENSILYYVYDKV